MKKEPAVYSMANRKGNVLYVGVTSNIRRRVWQHKTDVFHGFTHWYNVKCLVYYEFHVSMIAAIRREKQRKHGNRATT